MVEIRFRNRLNHLRSQVYNQPFRLSNVWPDGLNLLDQTHQVRPPDRSALQEDQDSIRAKEPRRLKLPPVSKLKSDQITFSNYLNYLIHHIIHRYDQDHRKISYEELKSKVDNSERLDCPEFSMEDVVQENPELERFIERLMGKANEHQHRRVETGSNQLKRPRSILLTSESSDRMRTKVLTRRALIHRSVQALLSQGTIIISPSNERAFTIPNVWSLGVQIVKIINHRSCRDTLDQELKRSTDPRLHPTHPRNSPENLIVSLPSILQRLRSDQLWSSVSRFQVLDVLRSLQFTQIDPDVWSLLRSS